MAEAIDKKLVALIADMRTRIDAAKVEKAKLEGQFADRMTRLKELGFDTTEAAEARLEALQQELAELDDKVRRGVAELEEKYGL